MYTICYLCSIVLWNLWNNIIGIKSVVKLMMELTNSVYINAEFVLKLWIVKKRKWEIKCLNEEMFGFITGNGVFRNFMWLSLKPNCPTMLLKKKCLKFLFCSSQYFGLELNNPYWSRMLAYCSWQIDVVSLVSCKSLMFCKQVGRSCNLVSQFLYAGWCKMYTSWK